MKFFAVATALTAIVPVVFAQQLHIDTLNSAIQCQPALITFGGGVTPYFVTVQPVQQISAPPLKSFPQTSATQITWVVDLAGNTQVTLMIKDSTGATAFSGTVNILTSGNSSCVNPNVNVPGASGTASGGSTPSGSSSATNAAASKTTGSSAPKPTGAASRLTIASFGSATLLAAIAIVLM